MGLRKKKLVPREGGCVGGSCDRWVLGITWRVFRPSGIEKQWTKFREEAMLQSHQGIPCVEPTESRVTVVLEFGDYEPHLSSTFSKSH